MTAVAVSQHPASVDAYIRAGWHLVPIPHGTKGPQTAGWNRRENTLKSHLQLPQGWGIGLAHAYSGTMALDVDDWDRASFELMMQGISLQALYDAPDAVIVDSGRQGHGKLLYAMPFGLALPSKKLLDDRGGERYNYLDFRCGTANGLTVQDVLPPSIHPETNQPYRWAGRGHWTRLPQIPDALLRMWSDLLEKDKARALPATSPIKASWSEIEGALAAISPDCSRDEWITVGMALHYAGTQLQQLDQALYLWDEWSQPSTKYPGQREVLTQWNSFRPDKATSVKLGSLFHLATRYGWVRPAPDVTTMFAGAQASTPAKVELDLKPPAPELNLDLMPPELATAALSISEAVGCDPLVPLWAGLATVSAAMDARSRLEMRPGFKVPPVLWAMTIGNPADKKTPGSAPLFDVLKELEAEDRPRYRQAVQVFEALEARHEAARKAYLDAAKDTDSLLAGTMPQGYGDAPVPPSPLRILTSDVTSQKLIRLSADNPRGIMTYLDEMNSWVDKLIDPRSQEQKSAWTMAFEAKSYRMDRVGAGEIEAENYAVSIYGNIQPRVFRDAVHKMSKDGLLQRFIPVVLRDGMTRLGKPTRQHQQDLAAFNQMVRVVFGLPAMTYTLAPDAEEAYVEFQKWYHQRLADEKLLKVNDVYLQAFGKLEGLVGRIILLLHVMLDPYGIRVSKETVERGVALARTYIVPAMRYTYNGDMVNSTSFDQWVMEHVIQYADKDTLTLSDIRASARRQVDGMSRQMQIDMILSAMYPLEQAAWVMRVDEGGKEMQGVAQWAVNPHLREQFADHRRRVIEAKQRMMDHVYRDAVKRRPQVHGAMELEN